MVKRLAAASAVLFAAEKRDATRAVPAAAATRGGTADLF
jgi:hypothetical protein